MGESHENLLKVVRHCQESLDKYTENRNESKLLHYLDKLYKLPIKVVHLEQTGVGRTVNGLRKLGGDVGDSAKSLVAKWKEMVVGEQEEEEDEEDEDEDDDDEDGYQTGEEHSSDSDDKDSRDKKVKDTSSSHRKSDSNRTDDYVKKSKNGSTKGESSSKREKHNGHSKYKTHKRKSDSSSSEDERPRKKSRKSDDEERHKTRRFVESDSEVEVKKESKHKSRKHKSEHKERKVREVSPEVEEQPKSSKSREKYKESSSREKYKSSSSSSSSSNNNNSSSSKKEDSKKTEENKKSKDKEKKSKHREKERDRSEDKVKSSKSKSLNVTISNNGIDSGSGASFAEALGMCEPSSSKNGSKKKSSSSEKKEKTSSKTIEEMVPKLLKEPAIEPIDINLSSLLPPITPNYRPLSNYISSEPQQKKFMSESEALANIITSKNQRTKVYSGNKVTYSKVPSLFELCTRVLQDNIDALEYTGGVPYLVLKPILEKANPNQLYTMEHHNPYLIDETDELWQLHCQKEFRNKKREELETWREMYLRCLDERDAKLKALTANIKQAQDKSLPVRMTKLAYVDAVAKPPRNIARKQAKNGTAFDVRKPSVTPSQRLNSLATAGEAGKVAVPNPGSRAVERSSSSHATKPKKAPLMLKSISSFKNRFKR